MKKETLLEIILGTIGGLIFAIGMCMGLIPEWDMLEAGIVVGIIGFVILLCIVPVHRKHHPRKEKEKKPWNAGFTTVRVKFFPFLIEMLQFLSWLNLSYGNKEKY